MNVAIIGCGVMGQLHAQMAANCGLRITVCADAVKARASALAKTHGAVAVTDIEKALVRKDVDIVALTSPTPTHAKLIVAAAKAGKAIFCEKPITRTVAEGRTALTAVQKAGVPLFVGHVVRYFQEFEALRLQAQSGVIGHVGFIKTFRGGMCPVGSAGWFRDFGKSGGAVLDLLIHDFDWIRYAFGDIERVFCQNLMRERPTIMDYAMVTLTLKSGAIAQTIGSWAHPEGFRVKAELCGADGMLTYDSADAPIAVMPRNHGKNSSNAIVPSSPVDKSPYQLEWEDFIAHIGGHAPARVTPEDALAALHIAECALKSAKTGAPVTV